MIQVNKDERREREHWTWILMVFRRRREFHLEFCWKFSENYDNTNVISFAFKNHNMTSGEKWTARVARKLNFLKGKISEKYSQPVRTHLSSSDERNESRMNKFLSTWAAWVIKGCVCLSTIKIFLFSLLPSLILKSTNNFLSARYFVCASDDMISCHEREREKMKKLFLVQFHPPPIIIQIYANEGNIKVVKLPRTWDEFSMKADFQLKF